jgi:hypothetical protein
VSEYTAFHTLVDAGFSLRAAARVSAVLVALEAIRDDRVMPPLEWRPSCDDRYEPTPEEWEEYAAWSDRIDTLAELAAQDEAADRRAALEGFLRWREDRGR